MSPNHENRPLFWWGGEGGWNLVEGAGQAVSPLFGFGIFLDFGFANGFITPCVIL